nr:c-type cytochrome [Thalassoroseus pseudoceratinae]
MNPSPAHCITTRRVVKNLTAGLVSCLAILTVVGCSPPEAEFSPSKETVGLLPPAARAVEDAVKEHFGTPDEIVAWLRMPLAFGGLSGVVAEDDTETEDGATSTKTFKVDFSGPAMLVKYDRNFDDELSLDEFPISLQEVLMAKRGSKTSFERYDRDGNGSFSAEEIEKARIKSDEWETEIISAVNEENVNELIGQTLTFADGLYVKQSTRIADLDLETGRLTVTAQGFEEPVEPGTRIIVDFGDNLKHGRTVYMQHCMHCHGVTGDGNGPTAEYLNPLPRDYRQGWFKFASTGQNDPPNTGDLDRIIRRGIPGTYMPSFALLKEDEVANTVEYVRWLSMRGNLELSLAGRMSREYSEASVQDEIDTALNRHQQAVEKWNEGGQKGEEPVLEKTATKVRKDRLADLKDDLEKIPGYVDRYADQIATNWKQAQQLSHAIYPKEPRTPDTAASRSRGRLLYLRNNCHNCHGVTGEGNGPRTREFDKDPVTNEPYPTPGLYNKWGHPIEPRNLTVGMYRGGRRPLDLYRRIHEGMPGTPMPPYGKLEDQQIWDIVNYVMSLPYNDPMAGTPKESEEASEDEVAARQDQHEQLVAETADE